MIVYVKASEVHPRRGARRPPVVSARARFYLPALLRTFHLLIPPFCSRSTCLPATLSHAYANTGDTATATWNGASLDTHVPPPRTHGEWWRLFPLPPHASAPSRPPHSPPSHAAELKASTRNIAAVSHHLNPRLLTVLSSVMYVPPIVSSETRL